VVASEEELRAVRSMDADRLSDPVAREVALRLKVRDLELKVQNTSVSSSSAATQSFRGGSAGNTAPSGLDLSGVESLLQETLHGYRSQVVELQKALEQERQLKAMLETHVRETQQAVAEAADSQMSQARVLEQASALQAQTNRRAEMALLSERETVRVRAEQQDRLNKQAGSSISSSSSAGCGGAPSPSSSPSSSSNRKSVAVGRQSTVAAGPPPPQRESQRGGAAGGSTGGHRSSSSQYVVNHNGGQREHSPPLPVSRHPGGRRSPKPTSV